MIVLYILYILFPVLLLITGMRLYKNKGRHAGIFFRRMAYNEKMRKSYCRFFFSFNVLWVLLYSMVFPSQIDFIPTTLFLIFFISHKRTDRIMIGIRNSRGAMIILLAIFVLFLRYPPLLPCGVIVGLLLFSACFYPSASAMKNNVFNSLLLERERLYNSKKMTEREADDQEREKVEESRERLDVVFTYFIDKYFK